jgi:DNA-binding transcriptional regulator YiaG
MPDKSGRRGRAAASKASTMKGKDVRKVREAFGDTQRAFAERVGVATNTVTRWESGLVPVGKTAAILIRLLGQLHHKEHTR